MAKGKPHYLPNGELYTGPTHKTNGKLMTEASKMLSHTKPKKNKKKKK